MIVSKPDEKEHICFAEMRHGTTIKDLCIRFKIGKAIKLNIYRLVQFLCVHGIIRRIHKVQFIEENLVIVYKM